MLELSAEDLMRVSRVSRVGDWNTMSHPFLGVKLSFNLILIGRGDSHNTTCMESQSGYFVLTGL
jgi:hypothetical protein